MTALRCIPFRWSIAAAWIAVGVLAAPPVPAQFDVFGQNKIAYDRFEWNVYPSPHFDVHYYGAEEMFLEDVVSYAESAYLSISKALDHELPYRVPLIIYKTHAEFAQTNVDLAEIPEAVGAFAEPVQNRMVLPIDQPPDKLQALIAHELTHIFQFSIFYEGYLGRALRANAPLWIFEGMASYLAKDEDSLDQMVIRDAVVNNVLPPVQQLTQLSFLTYRYGHAIFDYIEQEHGKEGFRNFIYEYRKLLLAGNVERAIKEAFGYEVDEFNRRFNRYLRKKYFPVLLEKKAPEDYGREVGIRQEGVFTFSPTVSPSGELTAVLATPTRQDLDLVILSTEDGSKVRNLTRGWTNHYQELVAEAFEGRRDISWSPSGDQIAVFARRENGRPLFIFDALTGNQLQRIDLPTVAQAQSPAFSPDGRRVAFEGNVDGIVDILEYDLETRQIRNLTQDDAYDANPWYAADGKSLLYNRRIGSHAKIFSVDLSDPARKTQLTFGPSSDIQPAYSRDQKTVHFSSDRGGYGVFNLHTLDLATGEIRQLTDVVGGCFSPIEVGERGGETYLTFTAFFQGTFRLFQMPLRPAEAPASSSDAGSAGAEVEPFEPSLRLTIDEERKTSYRLKWDLDRPTVSVGVANDGTFLANVALQFSDLLGDHRIQAQAYSVSSYSNLVGSYANLKNRTRWGGSIFDLRDYYLTYDDGSGERDQVQRYTGISVFAERPLNRYYRVQASTGYVDRSQDILVSTSTVQGVAQPAFQTVSERYIPLELELVGDTTRYQSFGPFQGKRFRIAALYGANIGGDLEGDVEQFSLDFRAYKQLTKRSLLAWRVASVIHTGDRETYYSLGGLNQLRGYEFREYFGSRIAWTNLELRFPLIDFLRFPFIGFQGIRGYFFLDLGATWFQDGSFYDPESGVVRLSPEFDWWDSENDRFQDARGSYGLGFQVFFLGLQFNWVWAERMDYTRYVFDPLNPGQLTAVEADAGGTRTDFYVTFDF